MQSPMSSFERGDELLAGARAGRSLSFDRVAQTYDATRGGEVRAARHADMLAARLDPAAPVLEVGVGTGLIAAALAQRGFSMRGVDLSPAMLHRARQRLGPVVAVADAARLPLRDASQPQVCSVWVLHLVGDVDGVVADVARVLEPGGRWVILPAGGFPSDPDDPVDRMALPMEQVLHGGAEHGPRPSEARLRRAAARSGLIVESVEPAPSGTYESAPAEYADQLEQRTFSMCWDLDDATYEREVAPVVAALRALPDADRPLRRTLRQEIVVVLRRGGQPGTRTLDLADVNRAL